MITGSLVTIPILDIFTLTDNNSFPQNLSGIFIFREMKNFLILIFTILFTYPALSQHSIIDGKVNRGNFDLHYKTYGSNGDYIILLSGGPGSNVDYMQLFADSLYKDFRCVMLEQRGTSRSVLDKYDSSTIKMNLYVEDLEALRKHLKTDKFILLGSSWGALLSLLYASHHPDKVSKVIILGAGPLTDEYADIFSDNLRIRYQPYERELRAYWGEKRKDPAQFLKASYERDRLGMPAYFYNRQIGFEEAAKLKPTDVNYYVFPAFDQSHPGFDVRPLLKNISAKVLLIQGRQDPGGDANVIETHQLIKNSKLVFIERCGHMPELEKPVETWKYINEFLGINK